MTREEAIKVLSSYDVNGVWADVDGKPYNAEEQAEAFDMAIDALQAKPVKHGEWTNKKTTYDEKAKVITEWQEAQCSACGKWHTTPYMYYFDYFSYCPNCGAEMKKTGNDAK